ncbi:MAG: PD-(D/E)XK nuclease family protein [Planctomycetes bacterium]|nr:PD-(D/E)XK nuclease family protein [Planctomycetota bacterium]
MAMDRVFLGWDGPCLHKAARWLLDHYAAEDSWDLGRVILVTPGARAGRRLLEILVEAAGSRVLTPPAILTPGSLPERLYLDDRPVADDLRAMLARVHALRHADADVLHRILHKPPEPDDFTGWWRLADELGALHDMLAGDLVTHREVPDRCRARFDFIDEERWLALAELHERYERELEKHGLIDRHTARAGAIVRTACASDADVVLIAATDLNQVVRRMLTVIDDATPHRVTALIHASESEAAGFDALGCLVPEHWTERRIDLDMEHVHVADRPRDQAHAVLHVLESFDGKFSADQVTLGLGDETLAPTLGRTLDLAGVPVRSVIGEEVASTPPVLLLGALADFMRSGRFDDFAALLRHPDIEAYLHRTIDATAGEATRDWLTLLDRYLTDHLQRRPAKQWLGEQAESLKAVWNAVRELIPANANKSRPLPEWSEPIAAILASAYGGRALDRRLPTDAPLYHALDALAGALREQSTLDAADPFTPRVDLPTAVALTLARVASGIVPDPRQGPAVEMLGWLELQLDDAPALIVTGVNEGHVPQSIHAHAFLPDHARASLGLADNQRRFAREIMTLAAILHSRTAVHLVTGRRTAEGDPLVPSRLLLACGLDELPHRVTKLSSHPAPRPEPLLLPFGDTSRFIVPPPTPPAEPIRALSVTAFRDYIACPYRFYLKHVLKLETLNDRAVEMDPLAFGNLAHDVLLAMASSEIVRSTDPDEIAEFLLSRLDAMAKRAYGQEPPAAVQIQERQLGERLLGLALWQARQAAEGWSILVTERKMSADLIVDGEPFTVSGRIDRVDVHADGRVRIGDYKTADSAKAPAVTHIRGGEWVDLQLPLYRALAVEKGLVKAGTPGVELGYIQLPKKLSEIRFAAAPWGEDELQAAVEKAHGVIRLVRAGVFWPPRYPVDFAEEFAGICQDEALDRTGALAEGNRLAPQGGAVR